MYRPEGWKNPQDGKRATELNMNLYEAYEAGADAMLEGLRKNALNYVTKGKHERLVEDGYITWENEKSGWVIFIPEEE